MTQNNEPADGRQEAASSEAGGGNADGHEAPSRGEVAVAEPDHAAEVQASAEERLAVLAAEKQEVHDRMLRIAAEFENWKKRARRDAAESDTRGKEAVLRDMLEVIDNLERAQEAWGESADQQGVQQGVTLVLRLFQAKLERHGVRAIAALGQPFDPRLHDAVSQVEDAAVVPGTIVRELARGYRVGDRLLRPATVVVAVSPALAEAPAAGTAGESSDGEAKQAGAAASADTEQPR